MAEALRDDVPAVRVEARKQFVQRHPGQAVEILGAAIKTGTSIEAQGAIKGLVGLKSPDADAVIGEWLDRMLSGDAPAAIQLDLLEARAQGVQHAPRL